MVVGALLEVQGEALKPLRLSSASILCCERMSEGVVESVVENLPRGFWLKLLT
jgi:hypothetical protein